VEPLSKEQVYHKWHGAGGQSGDVTKQDDVEEWIDLQPKLRRERQAATNGTVNFSGESEYDMAKSVSAASRFPLDNERSLGFVFGPRDSDMMILKVSKRLALFLNPVNAQASSHGKMLVMFLFA